MARYDGTTRRTRTPSREPVPKWSHGDPIPDGAKQAVEELLEQGFRKKQIALRTGLSLNLVRELVNGPEASRFPTVEARREAVQEQVQQGCKLREIIARLHLSESIVRADIRQLGIDINSVSDAHEETAERKAAILDLHSKGMSADAIAEEMNMSRWQVKHTLKSIDTDAAGS